MGNMCRFSVVMLIGCGLAIAGGLREATAQVAAESNF
jgi:hypothetical protein